MSRLSLDVRPEHPLLFLQLGLQLGIGPPHGLDLEQKVHLLQRYAARLGDEEEGKEEGEEGQRPKEKVHAVAHGGEHLLREAGDEEVEEPVAGGRGTACKGSEIGVKEFLSKVALALVRRPDSV